MDGIMPSGGGNTPPNSSLAGLPGVVVTYALGISTVAHAAITASELGELTMCENYAHFACCCGKVVGSLGLFVLSASGLWLARRLRHTNDERLPNP